MFATAVAARATAATAVETAVEAVAHEAVAVEAAAAATAVATAVEVAAEVADAAATAAGAVATALCIEAQSAPAVEAQSAEEELLTDAEEMCSESEALMRDFINVSWSWNSVTAVAASLSATRADTRETCSRHFRRCTLFETVATASMNKNIYTRTHYPEGRLIN